MSKMFVTKRVLGSIANNLKHDKLALALVSAPVPGSAAAGADTSYLHYTTYVYEGNASSSSEISWQHKSFI